MGFKSISVPDWIPELDPETSQPDSVVAVEARYVGFDYSKIINNKMASAEQRAEYRKRCNTMSEMRWRLMKVGRELGHTRNDKVQQELESENWNTRSCIDRGNQ